MLLVVIIHQLFIVMEPKYVNSQVETSFRSNQVTFGDLNPSDISGMDRSIKLL